MDGILRNVWEEYGFKDNPFRTNALSLYNDSIFPIEKAFVGRESTKEAQILGRILGSLGGARVVVEGEIGVGKTTFVNYFRYLSENPAKDSDKMFTPFGEISFQREWTARDFLLNVISHILHKLLLTKGKEKLNSHSLFRELLVLDRVYLHRSYQVKGQVLGVGGGYGKSENASIPSISEARLIFYLQEVVEELLKMGYRGVVLHFDNLELMAQQSVRQAQEVFDNLRDLLQMEEVYFIFIGQTGFFRKVISPLERVRSIFYGWPILVPPLEEEEVLEVFQRRYELLAIRDVKWIKPVEDECILYLYKLYEGKIRFIMDAVQAVVNRYPLAMGKSLKLKDIKKMLFGFMEEKFLQVLNNNELQMLLRISSLDRFTNAQFADKAKLNPGTTHRYLQKFVRLGFVQVVEEKGREKYYEVGEDVAIFRKFQGKKEVGRKKKKFSHSLTARQRQILRTLQRGPATVAELTSTMTVSHTTVRSELKILEKLEMIGKEKVGRSWTYYPIELAFSQ